MTKTLSWLGIIKAGAMLFVELLQWGTGVYECYRPKSLVETILVREEPVRGVFEDLMTHDHNFQVCGEIRA